jgi:hypothetical protein
MRRARFKPKKTIGVPGIERVRQAEVEEASHLVRKRHGVEPYEVRLTDVDSEGGRINTIPVTFYVRTHQGEHPGLDEHAVIYSMTMQKTGKRNGVRTKLRDRNFGPEGKKLYSGYDGYAHALPILAAFLRKRGVKDIWLPDADTVHENKKGGIKRHVLGEIYDHTAKRLGLGKRVHGKNRGDLYPMMRGKGRYFRIKTENFKDLGEHFEDMQ